MQNTEKSDNAYVVDLPDDFNMSATFNMAELHKYYDGDSQLRTITTQVAPSDVALYYTISDKWTLYSRCVISTLTTRL